MVVTVLTTAKVTSASCRLKARAGREQPDWKRIKDGRFGFFTRLHSLEYAVPMWARYRYS